MCSLLPALPFAPFCRQKKNKRQNRGGSKSREQDLAPCSCSLLLQPALAPVALARPPHLRMSLANCCERSSKFSPKIEKRPQKPYPRAASKSEASLNSIRLSQTIRQKKVMTQTPNAPDIQ